MDTDDTFAQVATRRSSVHWSLQSADGASVGVCSQRHGQRLWLARRELDPAVRLRQTGSGVVSACTHCGWCGDLVVAPARCTVHVSYDCPDFDAFATDAAQGCVALIATRLEGSDLPETFWHYLPIVARTARESGRLEAAPLAELMWRVRGAWQPELFRTPEQL